MMSERIRSVFVSSDIDFTGLLSADCCKIRTLYWSSPWTIRFTGIRRLRRLARRISPILSGARISAQLLNLQPSRISSSGRCRPSNAFYESYIPDTAGPGCGRRQPVVTPVVIWRDSRRRRTVNRAKNDLVDLGPESSSTRTTESSGY